MIKGRTLYFDEKLHKYTDDMNLPYTSVTTIIGKYCIKFDTIVMATNCARIGRNPNHPKYELYKGMSEEDLIRKWEDINKKSLDRGNSKHNYMEETIKGNSKFKNRKSYGVLYTLDDIQILHDYGRLNMDEVSDRIKTKYPNILKVIEALDSKGYKFYAEIGVYDVQYLVSGMIDLFVVNEDNEFYILDWKTNRAPIRFESGYWGKDKLDNLTTYIEKDDFMKHPLDDLAFSIGNEYAIQTTTYAILAETFGYKCKGIVICHIRPIEEDGVYMGDTEELHKIEYLKYKPYAIKMLTHHREQVGEIQSTLKIFN
jgi:hypothetical protein